MRRSSDSINPHRLYKNQEKSVLMGVCAGIANYFDISISLVRLAFFIALFFSAGTAIVLYFILGFVLEEQPIDIYQSSAEESFWRDLSSSPKMTLSDLKMKMVKLEQKIQNLESKVTSKEYELSKKFNSL